MVWSPTSQTKFVYVGECHSDSDCDTEVIVTGSEFCLFTDVLTVSDCNRECHLFVSLFDEGVRPQQVCTKYEQQSGGFLGFLPFLFKIFFILLIILYNNYINIYK